MEVSKFKIHYSDLDNIIKYLIENLSFDYENHSADMSILASEEFYFRSSSTQLNMVIAKKIESAIIIDIIGGAGGSGMLNLNWWSEKGYIKRLRKVLYKFTMEHNLPLEEL